jgi:hypothetical protein
MRMTVQHVTYRATAGWSHSGAAATELKPLLTLLGAGRNYTPCPDGSIQVCRYQHLPHRWQSSWSIFKVSQPL